jgi:hypothetical protein
VGAVMKYDLAYSLYTLAGCSNGNTPYRSRYPEFWAKFGPAIPTAVQPALDQMRELREKQGFLFGSSLARLFARVDGDSIAVVAGRIEADAPEIMTELQTWGPGYVDAWNGGFKSGVLGILRAMEAAGFEDWWTKEISPSLRNKAELITNSGIAEIPIGAEIERWSGKPVHSGPVHLVLTYFAMDQGQQILFSDKPGLIYLADAGWPLREYSLQLVHEVAHNQLLDWTSPQVLATVDVFAADPYFKDVFDRQIVVSGYTSLASFIEENITEGAQMIMARDLGIDVDAKAYLRVHDGGTHVLSAALLTLLDDEKWGPGGSEAFQPFFLRMVASGKFAPGQIQALRDRFFDGS